MQSKVVFNQRTTAYFPPLQKLAAVIRLQPSEPTSFHSATFFSGMFQSRSLQSNDPDRKYLSFRGWNAMAVTKSSWRKEARPEDVNWPNHRIASTNQHPILGIVKVNHTARGV